MEADDLKALGLARHEARRWRRNAQIAEALLEECLQMTSAVLGLQYGRALIPIALDRLLSRANTLGGIDTGPGPVPSFTQAIPARVGEADDHPDQLRQQGRPEERP